MYKRPKSLLIIIMITTIFIVPFESFAYLEEKLSEPSSFDYFFDIIVWRPLGISATVLGTGLFVITLPFSLPTKTVTQTREKLIEAPYNFTFKRPWGEEP